MFATSAMAFSARSDFVPWWAAPVALVLYPFQVVLAAGIDVYGQMSAIVR